ncbi:MAG: hypothetical protein IPJ81_17975 [Chitinophagaceae bacterium]|nr:hypothetical protein [Chitinophagaceae bacterium]
MKKALQKGPAQRLSLKNKYLPLITIVGFLLSSLCAHAQFYDSTKLRQTVNAYGFDWKNGKFRGSLIVPTGTGLIKMANKDSGSIAYHNGIFYGNNGYEWNPLGNGAAVPTWQGTLLAPNGSILTQDNLINSKGYTFSIDSARAFYFGTYANDYDSRAWYTMWPDFDDGNQGHQFFMSGEDASDTATYRLGLDLYLNPVEVNIILINYRFFNSQ